MPKLPDAPSPSSADSDAGHSRENVRLRPLPAREPTPPVATPAADGDPRPISPERGTPPGRG